MKVFGSITRLWKKSYKVGLLIIHLLASTVVLASDSICFLSPPSVAAIDHYTLNDGLASNNLGSTFIDSKGRMWVNPDVMTAGQFGLSFFQFDGTKSIFHDLKPDGALKARISNTWYVMGETVGGFLYGADRMNRAMFYWHPDTKVQYFIQMEDGERLLSVAPAETGGILLLTVIDKVYNVRHFQNGELKNISKIELSFKDDLNFAFPNPFTVSGDKAWFFHQSQGLVEANLKTGKIDFNYWSDLVSGRNIEIGKADSLVEHLQWNMFTLDDQRVVLFLGQDNGFFKLDHVGNQFIELELLNQQLLLEKSKPILLIFHSEDRKGNHLFVTEYIDTQHVNVVAESRAVLLDSEGAWYDYTNIITEIDSSSEFGAYNKRKKYFSLDFHRQLGFASSEGLTLSDLKPDLNITSYPFYVGARAIRQIGPNHMLVNTDTENLQVNLRTGEYHLVQNKDFSVEILTPFVDKLKGKILMSCEEQGLISYDIENRKFELLEFEAKFVKFDLISEDEIIFVDSDGSLFIHDLKRQITTPFLYQERAVTINSQSNELAIINDSVLWIGAQNGLWKVDLYGNAVENYPLSTANPVNVLCVHEGEKGVLWLGTVNAGVLLFDTVTGTFQEVDKNDGLSSNTVAGILRDKYDNRWIATFRGISVLSQDGKVLFEIQQEDGLVNSEFNRTSYATLPDGRLAFGGINGVDILQPESILAAMAERNPVQIYLTRFEYFDDERRVINGDVKPHNYLEIPATHRYINLDFAISEYVDLTQHQYYYRLLPHKITQAEEASYLWNDLGALSQLSIGNLPVGYYNLQVRGIDQNGAVTAQPLEIPLHVNEYFYKRWWFYLLVALPFLIAIFLWIRRIKGEQARLEKVVKRRTEELRRDKETIEEQAVQLQQLDKAKTRFFTNISHEFRTPLTVILGMVEQFKEASREKKLIKRNANQLLKLINQILELGKLEAGNKSASYVQGDVITFLKYFIESFHSLAEQKNVELDFKSNEDTLILDYDPEKLNHIVSNLLTNAIKFTPEGGKVQIVVEVHEQATPPLYQFSVIDSGIGIPQEKLPNIFNRFFQAGGDLYQGSVGVGIGLSLVRELVKLLKGNISVQSVPGEGTKVMVLLPYTKLANPEENLHEGLLSEAYVTEPTDKESFSFNNPTEQDPPSLLIVEDHRDVAEYLTTCLKDEYRLHYAADGVEGTKKALEVAPDIIISDVMMPRQDGLQMCSELKNDERTSHIPIILLTAKADIESKLEGLECGADVYLAKPFHKKELQVQLRNLAQTRRRLRERYANIENLEDTPDKSIQKEDAFIIRLRETIRECMHEENFGVVELGRKVGMSRTQLHNKIKALTDLSTSHFIRKVRMHQAARLLQNSDMNISQVAFEVGVDSLPYFTKIFTKEIGLSPTKYREKALSEQ